MSKFSEYLRYLIARSGESVSSISRDIGAERTSIHKALSGERILPYKTVQNLAVHFGLSLDERQEFFRLYNSHFQGEEVYANRQAVCQLLNDLSALRFDPVKLSVVPELSFDEHLLHGEYRIRTVLKSVLTYELTHCEKPVFDLFLPAKLDFTAELMELWLSVPPFQIRQLLSFRSEPSLAVENLQLLRSVIPLCLASRGAHQPYYFQEPSSSMSLFPMGYYVITPHFLLQLSADLSTAQLRQEPELVSYFHDFFNSLLSNCQLLTQCNSNILNVLQEYISNTVSDSLKTMIFQPCLGRYYTQDIIHKYLKSNDIPYTQMFHLVDQHFSVLRNITKDYCILFTEKGLTELAHTGSLIDMPPQYVPPLEIADRRAMLHKLRCEVENNTVKALIARPAFLKLPDYLSIYITKENGLHFYTTNQFLFGAYCCNIHITEESICRLFSDFFQALPGSPLVYSREDTLSILDQILLELH